MTRHELVWSQLLCDILKELWNRGIPTSQIAKQMKISKNAVIGKARRLGLQPRPSPIRRSA